VEFPKLGKKFLTSKKVGGQKRGGKNTEWKRENTKFLRVFGRIGNPPPQERGGNKRRRKAFSQYRTDYRVLEEGTLLTFCQAWHTLEKESGI